MNIDFVVVKIVFIIISAQMSNGWDYSAVMFFVSPIIIFSSLSLLSQSSEVSYTIIFLLHFS